VEGGVFVWAGGVKAPELVADSGLPADHNGRVKVDPRTGHVLPPLAQVALEEGETVARNLDAELRGRPLEAFAFHDKGFVVSVGTRRAWPTSPASPPAGGWPTCSKTPSSGSTASPSGTCAAGIR
jgi:NADH dehydrogenase FAD-containing subunit